MAAATTVYALPYPVPTDPADVPADVQKLANRIEAVVGPGSANGQIPVWDNTNKKWVATAPAPPAFVSPDLGYAETTATTTVSAAGEGAAQAIVTLPAITFDGTTKIEIEAFFPQAGTSVANGTLWGYLFDGGTSIGIIGAAAAASGNPTAPWILRRRLTPSAGSHTYGIRASITGGNGTIICGAGGAGTRMPGYIKATRV